MIKYYKPPCYGGLQSDYIFYLMNYGSVITPVNAQVAAVTGDAR